MQTLRIGHCPGHHKVTGAAPVVRKNQLMMFWVNQVLIVFSSGPHT